MAGNAEIAGTFFAALAAGDFAGMGALLADDVVLVIPGSFSRAGTFRGREGVFQALGQLVEGSDGTLKVELVSTAVNGIDGDQVIARYHATGVAKGEPLDEDNALLFTMADGLIVHAVDFYGDPETVERQWD
jgi:ketosteroid isomerase-like protein